MSVQQGHDGHLIVAESAGIGEDKSRYLVITHDSMVAAAVTGAYRYDDPDDHPAFVVAGGRDYLDHCGAIAKVAELEEQFGEGKFEKIPCL